MAKTKTAKKASAGKSVAKPKKSLKVVEAVKPVKVATMKAAKKVVKKAVKKAAKPAPKLKASKPAAKAKPAKKAAGKPVVKPAAKPKVASKPAPTPAPKNTAKSATPAKKPVVAAKPGVAGKPVVIAKVTVKPVAAAKQPVAKSVPAAKPVPTKPAEPVNTVAPVAPVKTGTVAGKTIKPSKTANIMSSKDSISTSAKPAAQKAVPLSAAGKSPAPGAGMASPLQAATKGFTPYVMQKGEEYMTEKQKEHFRKMLLNWRDELMQEVDRTVHHMQDEAANPPDPADRATLEEEFSLELRTRDRERRLIKKIDSTIELIANNDYGYCDSCGVEIGIRRLEARPTANKCIDCKTLDEIKEKQVGSA